MTFQCCLRGTAPYEGVPGERTEESNLWILTDDRRRPSPLLDGTSMNINARTATCCSHRSSFVIGKRYKEEEIAMERTVQTVHHRGLRPYLYASSNCAHNNKGWVIRESLAQRKAAACCLSTQEEVGTNKGQENFPREIMWLGC